jgi:hypothetical protein
MNGSMIINSVKNNTYPSCVRDIKRKRRDTNHLYWNWTLSLR